MVLLNILWIVRLLFIGHKFDKLQKRQQNALRNQLICIKGESLTHASFSGPDAWKLLKMGKWDRLYDLLHFYANVHIGDVSSSLSASLSKNLSGKSMSNIMNDSEFFEMQHLKSEFDGYVNVLESFKQTIVENSINPKMCGIGLSGALFKTLVGGLFALTVGVLKALFF